MEVEEQIKHALSAKHKSLEDVQAILLAKVRQISGTVTTRGARFHAKISESSSNNDESHLKWVSFWCALLRILEIPVENRQKVFEIFHVYK